MAKALRRPLSLLLGALATTSLGGCYYGDVYSSGDYAYAGNDCSARYGDAYYDADPYAYDDGYGYDCYDGSDYSGGFVNIGFGGGWYDNYYYPGYGLWLFDSYNHRYPLRGQYLNYWGGRRAWWKHHGRDDHWRGRDHDRPRGDGRPGGWGGHDRDGDGNHGTRPPRPGSGSGATTTNPPTSTHPVRPGRPGGWSGRDRDGRTGDGRGNGWGGRPEAGSGGQPPVSAAPPRPSRPDRAPGTGATPPVRTTPVPPSRPDRVPGMIRPRPAVDGASGATRPRPSWQSTGQPGGDRSSTRPVRTPPAAASAPAPAQRPAPAARPAPSPSASPPPSRPSSGGPRPARADRPNNTREN